MPQVKLDSTDRLLIQLVDKVLRAGVGRTFQWRKRTIKVLDINDKEVRITDGFEELTLPKNVREIAQKTAMLMGRME